MCMYACSQLVICYVVVDKNHINQSSLEPARVPIEAADYIALPG